MKNRPEYQDEIAIYNGMAVLCIRDMNSGGMSVTNGAEIVLKELADKYGTLPELIIYQDSDGIWDRMVWNGTSVTFVALRERNGAVALGRVTGDTQ